MVADLHDRHWTCPWRRPRLLSVQPDRMHQNDLQRPRNRLRTHTVTSQACVNLAPPALATFFTAASMAGSCRPAAVPPHPQSRRCLCGGQLSGASAWPLLAAHLPVQRHRPAHLPVHLPVHRVVSIVESVLRMPRIPRRLRMLRMGRVLRVLRIARSEIDDLLPPARAASARAAPS